MQNRHVSNQKFVGISLTSPALPDDQGQLEPDSLALIPKKLRLAFKIFGRGCL